MNGAASVAQAGSPDPGYFDYAASSPPFAEALAAQTDTAKSHYAHPDAVHPAGRQARAEADRLQTAFARLLGWSSPVVLTAGASEGNNLVVHGLLAGQPQGRILVAADAHASLYKAAHRYTGRVTDLPLDGQGRLSVATVAQRLTSEVVLVALSHAASETGMIHPVAAIADLCQRKGVACLIDAAQTVGHLRVDLHDIPADFITCSAHKFGGPRGIGALLAAEPGRLTPCAEGGNQGFGLRPGTDDLPGLAGMVAAVDTSLAQVAGEAPRLRALSQLILDQVRRAGLDPLVNGDPASGLPGLLSLSFPGLSGHALLIELGLAGFAVSTGSACNAQTQATEPSRVILALGRRPEQALGTLRISAGRACTTASAQALAEALCAAVVRQRALA